MIVAIIALAFVAMFFTAAAATISAEEAADLRGGGFSIPVFACALIAVACAAVAGAQL